MIVPRAPARGFQKAANAASALSRGRKPMESSALELSRVGGGSNHPWCSVSGKPGPRPLRRGGSFESETGLFQISSALALPAGSFEEKQPIVHEDEPRMDTNKHK